MTRNTLLQVIMTAAICAVVSYYVTRYMDTGSLQV